jgi:hypothetical protein
MNTGLSVPVAPMLFQGAHWLVASSAKGNITALQCEATCLYPYVRAKGERHRFGVLFP